MPLILNVKNHRLKKIIKEKFNFLLELFEFDPNSVSPHIIEVNVLNSTDSFLDLYKKEYSKFPESYVVGFAAAKGRIFILDEELFKEIGHSKDEFKNVVVHELCHIFLRRLLYPKTTFRWIEEGFCQYISFRENGFKIKTFIDFKKLENKEEWRKNPAYQQSAKFFEFLEEKFGMKKIICFVKLIKLKGEYEAFKDSFGDFEIIQKEFLRYAGINNENCS